SRKTQRGPDGPRFTRRLGYDDRSVTTATATTAAAARRGGWCAHTVPTRLDSDQGDAPDHLTARARRTRDNGLRPDELLELDAALPTAELVDRHALSSIPRRGRGTVTGRPAGRSSSRTPRRFLRGSRRSRRAGCRDLP